MDWYAVTAFAITYGGGLLTALVVYLWAVSS